MIMVVICAFCVVSVGCANKAVDIRKLRIPSFDGKYDFIETSPGDRIIVKGHDIELKDYGAWMTETELYSELGLELSNK